MFAKPFNRKAAIIAGLLVLIFDALTNYFTIPSGLGHVTCTIYMLVNFPGWIPSALLLMLISHPVGAFGYLLVDIFTSALSAAVWALIFGYVIRQKVAA